MIEQALNNGVLTIRLAHGKASALDVELLQALTEALGQAQESPDVGAVVLTGTDRIFSAGVDLKRLLDQKEVYARQFIPLLDQTFEVLFEFPKPVVAAVNGHAIAGGCILAQCCDIRLMAEGQGRIGIPEMKVGVPFPVSAFEVLRFVVDRSRLQSLMIQAETFTPEQALQKGLVDELLPTDALAGRAQALAEEMARIPAETYRISKSMLRAESLRRIQAGREQYARQILDCWSGEDTYSHIQGYLEATLKK